MQIGIVGLGRIGKNVCLRLLDQGVPVVAFNRSREKVDEVVAKGAIGAYSLGEMAGKLTDAPAVVILYVPAGEVVDEMLFGVTPPNPLLQRGGVPSLNKGGLGRVGEKGLVDLLPKDSIIIDGGNSFYKDSQKRYELVKQKGLHFLDMGTSGGLEGARTGACLMVGGDESIYKQVEPLLSKIATTDGFGYFGASGAGHFVKMVHNAIEYGMMGAIAEGFNVVRESEFNVNLPRLAKVWAHGSIVSGLLMNKTQSALEKDPDLNSLSGEVNYGETEKEMEFLETVGQPIPVISSARKQRVETRTRPSFIGKVIAALRREFGGHAVK